MNVFRVLAFVLALVVAVGIGTAVYNAGVTAGLAEAARQAAANGDPVPVVPGGYYGWGPYGPGFFGFGFFGIIFWILGIFLIIGLVRGAFGRGRWGGPGGGPGRREGIEAWHRELHRRDGSDSQPSTSGG
ncbi:MAG: hypothetical protein K5924_03230 [Chloroflexi bacterium]|nr:hypothetical protein [Chloroflexota bacterium]